MAAQKPHICFIAPHAYPVLAGDATTPWVGGAEVQQVLVARGLARRGYQVSMVCLDSGQGTTVELDGVKVIWAYRPDAGLPVVRFVWPRLTSMWRCLHQAEADIYYQRTAAVWTGVMAMFARRAGKKSIFAAAGDPDLEPRTPRLQYSRDRWIFEYGLRHVDRILVQNEEQNRLCRTHFGRRATLVPNCFDASDTQLVTDGSCVLWAATIRAVKRPDLFLDLAEALPHLRFKMIGGAAGGEERLFEETRRRAAGIRNLEFLGFVPFPLVEAHFRNARLLVNTSASEGFPNTFLQAWAHGIPTVSFVDCGARWHGAPVGHVVSSWDGLANAVSRIDMESQQSASDAAMRATYVREVHGMERILDLYEGIFDEVLAGKGDSGAGS